MSLLGQERGIIERNRRAFDSLVASTTRLVSEKRYECACVMATITAHFAATNYPGRLSSPELERALRAIGNATLARRPRPRPAITEPGHVLHVLTEAHAIGGSSRALWRWVRQDSRRVHSVVVTQQRNPDDLPHELGRATRESGGSIHVFGKLLGGPIARAQRLREIASDADLVVLHTHGRDIVPMLAFSDEQSAPAVARLDLADHNFWLGISISNAVFCMRDAAFLMAKRRRGVRPDRCHLVPIPMELDDRPLDREEARRRIGFGEDRVILLTIASGYKYLAPPQQSLLDAVMPLLMAHPTLNLIAVGPSMNSGEWASAFDRTGGRVRAMGPLTDTAAYYAAADIYLDSFPFSSNTSMLEAGGHRLPLVSYSPYCGLGLVLGPGCPGLANNLAVADDFPRYRETIETLMLHPGLRQRIGDATRSAIATHHTGAGWRRRLDAAYRQALSQDRQEFSRNEDGECDDLFDVTLSRLVRQANEVGLKAITEQEVDRARIGLSGSLRVIGEVWRSAGCFPRGALSPSSLLRIVRRADARETLEPARGAPAPTPPAIPPSRDATLGKTRGISARSAERAGPRKVS